MSFSDDRARTLLEVHVPAGEQVEVTRPGIAFAVGVGVESPRARCQHALHAFRDGAGIAAHALHRAGHAERVPEFERPESEAVAPAHGTIDLHDAVRNLRHHARRIDREIAKQVPQKLAGGTVVRHQGAQSRSQVLDAADGFHSGEFHLPGGPVLQRFAVQRPDLLVGAFADALVETLPALFSQPAALHHLLHDFGNAIQLARRVERRGVVQIAQHMDPHVQADHVDQAEAGAFRQADQRPGQRVHFLHREIELLGELCRLWRRRNTRCDCR